MQKIKEKLKPENNLNYKLNESYEESLKDKQFKEFVSKIKLKREEMIKYTSLLETSKEEYFNCKNCKNILECKNKLQGYAYLPKVNNNKLEFSYRPCKYKKKIDKEEKFHENTLLYNVPEEIKNADMKKIFKTDKKRYDTISWIIDFIEKYKKDKNQKGLYLCGNFGSGKSYLISAMFNELAKEGIKSANVFWPDFLNDLKGTFTSPIKTEFQTKYNSVKKAPLLLIDDIGAESVTPWSRDDILCPILQYRMDEKLPTFFTSNLDLKALENHLSITSRGDEVIKAGRIISRIKQLTEYQELISKNLRKWHMKINTQSSIKIDNIYFDPYKIEEKTNDASLIFITHPHYDHFDIESINKIINKDTIIVIPNDQELINNLKEYKTKIVEPNNEYEIKNIKFKTVPSYNINKPFHKKEYGWVGYIVNLDKIYYIMGDTDGIEEAKNIKCDHLLIPIGGTYTMNEEEAAELTNIIKPKIVTPIHYGSIVGNKEDAIKFKDKIDENIEVKIVL